MSTQRILFLAPANAVTCIFPQLRDAGFEVGLAENLKGASAFIRKSGPSVIFSRPVLPGYRIEDMLAVGEEDPAFPPVIVITDKGSPNEAVRLMELGARDYWLEPLQFEKVAAVLKSPHKPALPPPSSTLGGRKPDPSTGPRIVGSNPAIRRVLALARQVAPSKASVLISGASGTGKELFARTLHAWSDRANGPFIAVNCAALPEHLLESELFGHEKGAFTGAIARKLGKFELADGGTILLDEISEMDLALQAKLLRVLQEGEIDRVGGTDTVKVNVRILATTNRDMEGWVSEGKFRQDLFFRLNVIPLRIPALSERGEDVLELARFFITLYVREYHLAVTPLSDEAITWLTTHDWPGNVRELQNLMERAVLLAGGKPITPRHFLLEEDAWPLFDESDSDLPLQEGDDGTGPAPAGGMAGGAANLGALNQGALNQGALNQGASSQGASSQGGVTQAISGDGFNASEQTGREGLLGAGNAGSPVNEGAFSGAVIPLHEMERLMIMKGLEATSGNRTQAADLLGISVRTLRNKLNEYRGMGMDIDQAPR